MSKTCSRKELQDMAIITAISGVALNASSIQIENDYLKREEMENRMEQGLWVPNKYLPQGRTDFEKEYWKRTKWLEQFELDRSKREDEADEAHLQREFDEDRKEVQVSLKKVHIA